MCASWLVYFVRFLLFIAFFCEFRTPMPLKFMIIAFADWTKYHDTITGNE